ncbi:hypothetical protein CPC08DRAFT_738717 [Agrocybe pediades]|nr:hypothetical protein CPC08DRAFT_738717 [Agrocybe pediades]
MSESLPRYNLLGLDCGSDFEEPDAKSSSPGNFRPSSPDLPGTHEFIGQGIPFNMLVDFPEDDDDDSSYNHLPATPTRKRSAPLTDDEKTMLTLKFMTSTFSRFGLRKMLASLFSSEDPTLRAYANKFYADGAHIKTMEQWWDMNGGTRDEALAKWAVQKSADVCAKEASCLTNRASQGPYEEDARFLRVRAQDVNVKLLEGFSSDSLLQRYERVVPNLQVILSAVIAKDSDITQLGTRNPNAGRTLVTSILLNLRSRQTNYHASMNSLLLWDNQTSKRLVQAFNHLGITSSYSFQTRAIASLSKNSLVLAQRAANDQSKIKMLPYDNFNWSARAWESTALHTTVTHDEVSALLIIIPTPEGCMAADVTNISSFSVTEGTRHRIPYEKALTDILPSSTDQKDFREAAIIHVQQILTEEIQALSRYSKDIPSFKDESAIKPQKTEEYYLPTFDQEQGSTRGNMVVLEHYFGKVLKIPKETFEDTMFTVLGDRLTTVRDRAAQDQRAVDRSSHRFHHLSSFSMVSGLMHFILNFIHAIGSNYWGSAGMTDIISLATLRDILPNRNELNLRKVDYYAWLRFFDVVLRALVIQALCVKMNITNLDTDPLVFDRSIKTYEDLKTLSTHIVDSFLMPSVSRLEATGAKPVKGNTISGSAVLMIHDLMSIREMQHAIKHGHPQRIRRVIKYWLPMFYAAGSYNYANECMELLHNNLHDWPKDYAAAAFNGMLVNPSGQPDGFKPTDIRVEHLNDRIKERAHGSNATPEILEKITPAMGHVQDLTNKIFNELGVEYLNQRHAKVLQHKDIQILVKYFSKNSVFDFQADRLSSHIILDLYRSGSTRLAGQQGGHVKHLKRHVLRLRARHGFLLLLVPGPFFFVKFGIQKPVHTFQLSP